MKLKCLKYSKLGNAGDEIEITGRQAHELIAVGICEEVKAPKETKPATEKKTKGGKKPAEKIETK